MAKTAYVTLCGLLLVAVATLGVARRNAVGIARTQAQVDALADDVKPDTVIGRILQTVALPQVNAVPQQGHSVPPAGPPAGAAPGGHAGAPVAGASAR